MCLVGWEPGRIFRAPAEREGGDAFEPNKAVSTLRFATAVQRVAGEQ